MSYTLQAIVAKAGSFSEPLPQTLQVVCLLSEIDMLPLNTEALAFYGLAFCPLTDGGERNVSPQLLTLCEELSRHCSLAYIEAELFGGAGTQAHALFCNGKAVGEVLVSDNAINDALRYLGVAKGGAHDEFETVGLGRYRETDEWHA